MSINNTSNRNGRTLEYIITKKIANQFNGNLINGTKNTQVRDEKEFESLSNELKSRFDRASEAITTWLKEKYQLDSCTIDRLGDGDGVRGDVTDIRLNGNINLSIKHKHNALKHQRPGALAQQCGIAKKDPEDLTYRSLYQNITDSFLVKANQLNPNATLFKELKAVNNDFINDNLYDPMCSLVADFINHTCSNSAFNTEHLFKFIVGNTDFIKIIVGDASLQIQYYNNVVMPKTVNAIKTSKSYIKLEFDNGWSISMRLHTASSRINGVSLKFDSKPDIISVTEETLPH